ncbi:DNA topoisomerase IB [Parafrigoribacterium soli]|uniref:DNA topoisomerase IB n=1 Tax=Parafrigoribacterium soli TaxID=3144663 RepID=UPI0032ED3B7D
MRLRHSNSSGRGYARVRHGRGFTYRDPSGETVNDPQLKERFEALAIPPAWTDVWISPYVNGHIQATGVDAAGRRQYLYHPVWREQKDRIKFDRALQLAEHLPAARGRVTRALRAEGLTRERALAAAFRMLDTGSLRIGSERYADANGSHGLSTLLCSHAALNGDTVTLSFPAKSGQLWESDITDPDLAAFVRDRGGAADDPLLAWLDDEDVWHSLSAAEINADVKQRTGSDFSAKDFRTLRGTIAAAVSLAKSGAQPSGRRRTSAIVEAVKDAAAVLGNTPAIAKKSYVDPRVVDHFLAGETIDPARLTSAESELRTLLLSD